jgi:transposase
MLKLGMNIVLPILSPNQVQIAPNTCFFLAIIIMKALFPPQVQYIISLLQTGHPYQKIAQAAFVSPGTISNIQKKYLLNLPKSSEGHPIKLSPYDIHYATYLLGSREAETASQVARRLKEIKGTTISDQTIQNILKRAGLKLVGKKKLPYLKPRHCKAKMDFAETYQYWTVKD